MPGRDAQTLRRQDFIGGVWHGAFLAVAMAFASVTVVVPAFIAELTGSSIWVGGLAALMAVASSAPKILVARFVEPRAKKKPSLLFAIYLRAASWAALALLIEAAGTTNPDLVLAGMIFFIGLFAFGGALGGVPYTHIIGRVIPRTRRGSFFGTRQATGSVLAFVASGLSASVLDLPYPDNFATLFLLSAGFMVVASAGLWVLGEPEGSPSPILPWRDYLASLRAPFRELGGLGVVTIATGFAWLSLPFYVVAARRDFGVTDAETAWFVGAVVTGGLVGNLTWGRLVDRGGARRMILICVTVSTLAPIIALSAGVLGWQSLVVAAGLGGAVRAGKGIGYQSALLEIAPVERRSSYAGAYAFLSLPGAFMPLLGGTIAALSSYRHLFAITAALLFIAVVIALLWVRRDPARATCS